MKTVTKYTNNSGRYPESSADITATTDTLFLLSAVENNFTATLDYSGAERGFQEPYSFFVANSDKRHFDKDTQEFGGNGRDTNFLLFRSPYISRNYSDSFLSGHYASGSNVFSVKANKSYLVSPCFCI